MIQATCKNLIIKLSIWLMTEILLTFLGLDNLADYSEFISGKDIIYYRQTIYYVLTDAEYDKGGRKLVKRKPKP